MSPKNDTIKLSALNPGEQVTENLFIDKDLIFLEKGMTPTTEDLQLLKKWKLEDFYIKSYTQSEKKFSLYFNEQIKGFRDFTREFLAELKEFYEAVQLSYKLNMPNYDKYFTKLLNFYQNPNNYFSFYVNTDVNSSTYEGVALLTAFNAIMLGTRMNLKQDELKQLFYAACFADIGFQRKSEKTVMEQASAYSKDKYNFPLDLTEQLAFHVKLSCQILQKEMKASKELIYLVLTHHEYLDKSGALGIGTQTITPVAQILTLAHEYVYLTSEFLKSFRPPALPTNAMLLLLKHKERYDETILKNFFSVNSFFPPGEVLMLDNQQIGISIKATYRYPKRPIIELITQPKRGNSSRTETINLAEETLKVIALLDKPQLRYKLIRIVYSQISQHN